MGSGGSRHGAGRPAMHVKAEHCRRIDVRRWQREGILRPGAGGAWAWTNSEGERTASIGYRAWDGAVNLDYAIDGRAAGQRITLDTTACTYGGTRPWFVCPVRGERVAVLYLRAGRFACRHCQRIVYASQSGDIYDRTWRMQAKAEAKLGPNWARPKGMHATTRERLLSIIWDCEEQREVALSVHFASMIRQFPNLRSDPLFSSR